jgi:2-C-methyl-D-erythritol 2,4-cyclodiphosphate synthase
MSHSVIHRVGIGTDLHRLAPGRPLVLGHVRIAHETGPESHSDGDVVLHAVVDAIAGAAGFPDIGELFPDTGPENKDADSAVFLAEALRRMRERGFELVNLDVTIHAERPKLMAHKAAIRSEVSRLTGLSPEAVSIKAKTNERVDAIGRGEALACTAIVGLTVREES